VDRRNLPPPPGWGNWCTLALIERLHRPRYDRPGKQGSIFRILRRLVSWIRSFRVFQPCYANSSSLPTGVLRLRVRVCPDWPHSPRLATRTQNQKQNGTHRLVSPALSYTGLQRPGVAPFPVTGCADFRLAQGPPRTIGRFLVAHGQPATVALCLIRAKAAKSVESGILEWASSQE
jgi:hypothetical protein